MSPAESQKMNSSVSEAFAVYKTLQNSNASGGIAQNEEDAERESKKIRIRKIEIFMSKIFEFYRMFENSNVSG